MKADISFVSREIYNSLFSYIELCLFLLRIVLFFSAIEAINDRYVCRECDHPDAETASMRSQSSSCEDSGTPPTQLK